MAPGRTTKGVAGCVLLAAGALLYTDDYSLTESVGRNLRNRRNRRNAAAVAAQSEGPTPSEERRHKMGPDEDGMIWIVNQPKCGTGSIERSFLWGLGCEQTDGTEYGADKFRAHTRFFDCPGNKKLFRSHHRDSSLTKAHVNQKLEEGGAKPDKCVAITAVRDPLLSIPSRFFELKKKDMCEGTQTKEEALDAYKTYLENHQQPSKQAETTATMLRSFGIEDITGAMEKLAERGYAFFDGPEDEENPWAGCELLFLQIDYEESNANLDEGLDAVLGGIKMIQNEKREVLCPGAADNYHAMIEYEINDEILGRYAETNPEILEIINYYRKLQAEA